ncbi:hypothetical protein AXF42_Ash006645 [Apostasia shenzhenica]|uniref:Uncharacterized protein n=1 Tax=Apostasia shenzhenica TaxID=1088818 RepID=A0A2I0AIQ7_9ASPA|nr:hypothetical protein AXF42_Ash006645 [Apostasia shenzhenica]
MIRGFIALDGTRISKTDLAVKALERYHSISIDCGENYKESSYAAIPIVKPLEILMGMEGQKIIVEGCHQIETP